jgi:Rad3-related DNA helicase
VNIEDTVYMQDVGMTEEQREEYLEMFKKDTLNTKIGFCVLGGIFSEGIDLKDDRLIGAVIVGTGIPMVCTEREIYRGYYDDVSSCGFEYAYLYTGMNKVLQAAGRVIRTASDVGQILLLDERLLTRQYVNLFPREWFPYEVVDIHNVEDKVKKFWDICK